MQQLDGIQISEETTEGMGDIFVSVYQMDASEIPDSWKDLGQLDALLIGPEAAISGEQWVTLHRWQQEGGILLTVEDGQVFLKYLRISEWRTRPTFFDRLSEKWGYVVYTGYDTSQIPGTKTPRSDQIFYTDSFLCLSGRTGTVPDPEKTGKKENISGQELHCFLFFSLVL